MNNFLVNLKDELAYQNLSQKELAEKTEISVNTIRGWFSKDLSPDVFSAVKIAKALNVTVEYLVTGFDPDPSKTQLQELKTELLKLLEKY